MQSKNILSLVLAVLFLTSSFLVSAQNTLSSPYTKYGIGEVGLYSNAVTSAMGGVGYTLQRNNMLIIRIRHLMRLLIRCRLFLIWVFIQIIPY